MLGGDGVPSPLFIVNSGPNSNETAYSVVMRTKRLNLRDLAESDAERIAEFAGDWDIARMTARIPFPYSVPLAHQWMRELEPGEFVRTIDFDGELIGAVGYLPCEDGSAEIGYWIGKPWWGRGFATEAAGALVRYCFTKGGYSRLTCCHFVDNPASARVIVKLGFRYVGNCTAWCEARRADVETLTYERKRSVMSLLFRRAA
jgi:RimJ/RimL family protein N-acetyltransferase